MNFPKWGSKTNAQAYVESDHPGYFEYTGNGEIGEILRQGDLTFFRLAKVPSGLVPLDGNVVAVGEGRDHFHKAKGSSVQVLEPVSQKQMIDVEGHQEELFRVVKSDQVFDIAHELPNGERANHFTLKGIPKGIFAVFREREVDPFADEANSVQTVYD
jgi:hypothetical protein